MDMIKLLDDAEKAIATLMLEVNRLNDEIKYRELTDEEINQIVSENLESWNTKEAMIEFARAIIKKASNK
jgi:isopropylmalate/homocitrate/citramalate synthase